MKRIGIAGLLLLFTMLAWAGTPPIPADYNINVHVSASRMVSEGEFYGFQGLNVVIDGKKYQLDSTRQTGTLLALGDYRAKLVKLKDEHYGKYDSFQVYEILFPDQKTRQFKVVGQTE